MAAESSPAFSFYVRDWLSDAKVRAMTNDARGVYIDLLAYCWAEGALPSDDAQIARIARLTPGEFRRIWPQLQPCFTLAADGYRQKRLDRERVTQAAHRDRMSQRGQTGAAARWGKPCSSNAQALPPDGFASASASARDQEQRADAPSPDPPNRRVLTRLAHELPDLTDDADTKDELKRLAAQYRIPYDGASVSAALDAVARTRKAPIWVRDPVYGRRPAARRRRGTR